MFGFRFRPGINEHALLLTWPFSASLPEAADWKLASLLNFFSREITDKIQMCRAILVANPFLAMEDRRRQYVQHVKAMRTRPALIDDRQPIAPTRIENHRKRHQYMQKIMLQAGAENFKLISKSRLTTAHNSKVPPRETPVPTDGADLDWIKIVAPLRRSKSPLPDLPMPDTEFEVLVPWKPPTVDTSLGPKGRAARLEQLLDETIDDP
jgi:hypothetical protein